MGMSMLGAAQAWSDAAVREDPGSTTTCEKLERLVLDHTPTSSAEAVAMLDVVLQNLTCGGRSDGRDLKAVERVRDFLANGMRQA